MHAELEETWYSDWYYTRQLAKTTIAAEAYKQPNIVGACCHARA
jgi:hypothetical protein